MADRLEEYIHRHPLPDNSLNVVSSVDIDVAQLVKDGVLEVVPQNQVKDLRLSSSSFKIPKSDPKFARYVYNGQPFDSLLKEMLKDRGMDIPKMPSLSIREVVAEIRRGWKYISINDFKSFFFQIPIHRKLGNFLVVAVRFGDEIRYYRCIALPMGITFAPAAAQHIALYTKQLLSSLHPDIVFELIIWIDNVILLTNTEEDAAVLRKSYDCILETLGIAAKAWEFGTCLETLGLVIDLSSGVKISPSRKSLEKLNDSFSKFISEPTPRHFLAFHGSAMWITYMAAIPLCFIPDFMNILRSESRFLASFSDPSLIPWDVTRESLKTPKVLEACHRVRDLCLGAQIEGICQNLPPIIAAHSDASTSAMAGISIDNQIRFGLRFECSQLDIFVVELLAGALLSVLLRLRFGDPHPAIPWLWITDNTVAKFSILKGHSASPLGDQTLRFWFKWGIPPSCQMWVPTACMRADGFTRPDKFISNPNSLSSCTIPCLVCPKHDINLIPSWNTVLVV